MRHTLNGYDEADGEEDKVGLWQYLPFCHSLLACACNGPEEDKREGERDGQECREAISRVVVRDMTLGRTQAGGVAYESRNINLDQVQVM